MRPVGWKLILVAVLGISTLAAAENALEPITIADLKRPKPVDFGTEIIPVFQKNCLPCHNATDAKGDLVLETPLTIRKGGETGPSVVPGKSAESLLLKVAAHQIKPTMPPKNNKADAKALTSDELGLLKLWIDQGATGAVTALPPIHWQTLAESLNPIQTVAIAANGQFAACSRGNQIDLYDLPAQQFAGSLIAPGLNAADRDLVESLAFSPDGQLLAAGSFRNVKLWKMETPAVRKIATLPEQPIALSSDGKQFAVLVTNQLLRIFDLETKLLREISAETNNLRLAALTPDFQKIAGVLGSNQINIWTTSETNKFEEPGEVTAIAFGSSGELATAGNDNQLRIRKDGKEIKKIDHGSPARFLALSSDGKRLAAGGDSPLVRLYNLEDGKSLAEIKGDRREQENAAREQRSLAFAKSEVAFRKSNLETAEKQQKAEVEALKKVTEAKAAADKSLAEKNEATKKAKEGKAGSEKVLNDTKAAIAQATENKNLSQKLVETAEAQAKSATTAAAEAAQILTRAQADREAAYAEVIKLAKADKTADANTAIDRAVAVKLSFEHAQDAKATAEKAVNEAAAHVKATGENKGKAEKTLADLTTQQKDAEGKFKASEKQLADADNAAKQAETAVKNAETNLQGTTAVAKKADDAVADGKKLLASSEQIEKESTAAAQAADKRAADSEKKTRGLSFAGAWLIVHGDDGALRFFSADTGHPGPVRALAEKGLQAFSGNSTSLFAVTAETNLVATELAVTWKLERQIGDGSEKSPLVDRVLALDFSPDSKLLVTGGGMPSRSGELKIWNVADGALVREIKDAHSDSVFAARFSPDQKHLATGGADKLMKVFAVDTGKFVRSFEGHTHHVLNVSWNRHGRTLASAGADAAIKIWDFASGEQKKTITGPTREITALQFLDGIPEALGASGDNQIRLVREDGGTARSFDGATGYTQSAAITPDGRWLVAGGNDSQFRLWDGKKGDLLKTFAPPTRAQKALANAAAKQ